MSAFESRKEKAQHYLQRLGAIVGLAAAFFTLNAIAFDTEVDRKIGHAQQLHAQHTAAVLHNLSLLAQRQLVEGLAAELRLEEFLQTWYASELRREPDPGRLYELQRLSEKSQRRRDTLTERYRRATERLEALHAEPLRGAT